MSLINDALKKAQRARTGEALGSDGKPLSVTVHAHHGGGDRPVGVGLRTLLLAGGAVIILAIVAGTLYLGLRSESVPAPAKPSLAPGAAPIAVALPPDTAVAARELPAQSAESLTFVLPTASTTTPALPAPLPADAAPNITTLLVESSPVPVVNPVPALPPIPSEHMVRTIEAMQVSGIRALGADSKVLLNGRVYRIGDLVDRDFGLRLIEVTGESLTFRDQTAAVYTRRF